MIHISIDTDAWLWLIGHNIDSETNYLKELCYWVESGDVCCLLPEYIKAEWDRNKHSKMESSYKDFHSRIQVNKALFADKSLIHNLNSPEGFNRHWLSNVKIVDKLFVEHAVLIPVDQEVLLEAGRRTLERIAPSHAKDSFSDAVNILCLIKHLQNEKISNSLFCSLNHKDYSDINDQRKIHPDLAGIFENCKLEYHNDIDKLFGRYLRPHLPSYKAHLEQEKEKEGQIKLEEERAQARQLANTDHDYIDNISTIDHILAARRPTLFHQHAIFELIEKDEKCRQYFFRSIEKPFWFGFLKEKGYLKRSAHPDLPTEKSHIIPRWEIFTYLDKVSIEIEKGELEELLGDLIEFVKEACSWKLGNELSYSALVSILSRLPEKDISMDMLKQVTEWFNEDSNNLFLTQPVCVRLIPALVNSNTDSGIDKANFMLNYLFSLLEKPSIYRTNNKDEQSSFSPACYLANLKDLLIFSPVMTDVIRKCDSKLIFKIAESLKKVLMDFPRGLRPYFKSNGIEHQLQVDKIGGDLTIQPVNEKGKDQKSSVKITSFEKLDKKGLRLAIVKGIKKLGLNYIPNKWNEDSMTGLCYALTVDRMSMAFSEPVGSMRKRHSLNGDLGYDYAALLSAYLNKTVEFDPLRSIFIIKTLFSDHNYSTTLTRRLIIDLISNQFILLGGLFFELIENNDPFGLFNETAYQREISGLLANNKEHFNQEQIATFDKIIESLPGKKNEDSYNLYNRSKWYHVLNYTEPFTSKYLAAKEKLGFKDRDINIGSDISFRNTAVSPIKVDQLLLWKPKELSEFLKKYRTGDPWQEPNAHGLGKAVEETIILEPDIFLKGTAYFLDIPYLYIYHILSGILTLHRDKTDLDWPAILGFCENYLLHEEFTSSERVLKEDRWMADKTWVCAVINQCISACCETNTNMLNMELHANISRLLKLLRPFIIIEREVPKKDFDYLSHILNSNSGKFLTACLDYALCSARTHDKNHNVWNGQIKEIFEEFITSKSPDIFMLIGRNWQQLAYLDKNWVLCQLNANLKLNEPLWKCFMCCFIYSPVNGALETLSYTLPHYNRAIDLKLEEKQYGSDGLASHLTSLFFWDVDKIKEETSLCRRYVKEMPAKSVETLIRQFWHNKEYMSALSIDERSDLESRIIYLLRIINAQFSSKEQPDEINLRRSMVNLLYCIRELNVDSVAIVVSAISLSKESYQHTELLEPLHVFLSTEKSIETAEHMAKILLSMRFTDYYLADDDAEMLKDMLHFLFRNSQQTNANVICNRLSQSSFEFAKEIYHEYN